MVESRTARMRLVQWSSGTDSPQRVDFNETFLNIETLAAIDQQGTLGDRPNPNKAGMYYFATDTGTLYRSDGASWAVVGASVLSQLVRPARTDAVAHTIQGLASQTADLKRVLNSANVIYQRVRSNGDFIHGPLRVSQAGRAITGTEVVPTDSATTVDNASSSMWGLTLSNTTGNTTGFLRGLRGGSEVFSISSTGAITTPSVSLTSAPTSNDHATTKSYVDSAVANRTYALTSDQLTGQLPVSKGGTGGTTQATARSGIGAAASATTISAGDGLIGGGNLSANMTLRVKFPTADGSAFGASVGSDIFVSRWDHEHNLEQPKIIGILPVAKGGTGGTTAASARTGIGAAASATNIATGDGLSGGGDLSANRTLSVTFAGNGTATTVARSDHGHALTDANMTGTLPVNQGGTNATTAAAARTSLGAASSATTFTAGTGLSGGGNLGANRIFSVVFAGSGTANSAARSDHTHDINSSSITGTLSVAGGGTGRSSITSGNYVIGAGTAGVTSKTPAEVRTDIDAATSGHGHALTDANITGTLPVSQGGTGATTAAAARSSLAAASNAISINTGNGLTGGGNLTASRTLSVQFAGSGSANTAARSDHQHAFSQITGLLSHSQIENAIPLGSADDLDSYTSDGVFHQSANVNAASGSNYPAPLAGLLVVKSSAAMVYQIYLDYSVTGAIYYRTKYMTTWYRWKTVATADDIAALTNVYASKSHGHSLTDSNITGTLPISQGGTGGTTAAAARSALAVPSTSVSVKAGAGLSGGGTLASSRTLQVVFEGSGTATTAARSDHSHSEIVADGVGRLIFGTGGLIHRDGSGASIMTIYNTGQVTFNKSGASISSAGAITGASIPWNDVSSKPSTFTPSTHGHKLTDSNITGTLPVNQGGTGGTTPLAARNNISAASSDSKIVAGNGLSGGGALGTSGDTTLNVTFPSTSFTLDGSSTGSANIAARYNHKHNLTGTYIEGNLPWEKNSIPISLSTEDLDTLTSTAVYHQGSNANATSARNYPSSLAGLLEVTNVGSMTYQTYTDYTYNGDVWRRTKYGSNAWYGWRRMIDERALAGTLAEATVFRHVAPPTDITLNSTSTDYVSVGPLEYIAVPSWATKAVVSWSISHFFSNGTTSNPNAFWGQTRFLIQAKPGPDMGFWLSATTNGTRHEIHRTSEIDVTDYAGSTRVFRPQMRRHPSGGSGSLSITSSADVTYKIDFRP